MQKNLKYLKNKKKIKKKVRKNLKVKNRNDQKAKSHGPTDRPTDRHRHFKSSDGAKNTESCMPRFPAYSMSG